MAILEVCTAPSDYKAADGRCRTRFHYGTIGGMGVPGTSRHRVRKTLLTLRYSTTAFLNLGGSVSDTVAVESGWRTFFHVIQREDQSMPDEIKVTRRGSTRCQRFADTFASSFLRASSKSATRFCSFTISFS